MLTTTTLPLCCAKSWGFWCTSSSEWNSWKLLRVVLGAKENRAAKMPDTMVGDETVRNEREKKMMGPGKASRRGFVRDGGNGSAVRPSDRRSTGLRRHTLFGDAENRLCRVQGGVMTPIENEV